MLSPLHHRPPLLIKERLFLTMKPSNRPKLIRDPSSFYTPLWPKKSLLRFSAFPLLDRFGLHLKLYIVMLLLKAFTHCMTLFAHSWKVHMFLIIVDSKQCVTRSPQLVTQLLQLTKCTGFFIAWDLLMKKKFTSIGATKPAPLFHD